MQYHWPIRNSFSSHKFWWETCRFFYINRLWRTQFMVKKKLITSFRRADLCVLFKCTSNRIRKTNSTFPYNVLQMRYHEKFPNIWFINSVCKSLVLTWVTNFDHCVRHARMNAKSNLQDGLEQRYRVFLKKVSYGIFKTFLISKEEQILTKESKEKGLPLSKFSWYLVIVKIIKTRHSKGHISQTNLCKDKHYIVVVLVPNFHLSAKPSSFFLLIFGEPF